ncbi:MAG: hypothetical protein CMB80_02750 [Flammeovirgaceae bacterium]|nr:hypothetical protein [Flammeovirgaceae bacterium]
MMDTYAMAPFLRQVDKDEIMASHGFEPKEAITKCFAKANAAKVGCVDSVPFIMFGVTRHTIISDHASIWMLGTDELENHSIRFIRECHKAVVDISEGMAIIENWCDARNELTLRWLKWLGFTIEDPEPYGMYQLPFHHFYKKVA